MVRKNLSKKHVILEEDLLEKIADSTDKSETISLTTVSHHCISPLYSVVLVDYCSSVSITTA